LGAETQQPAIDPWSIQPEPEGHYIGAATILGRDGIPFTIVTDDGSVVMVHGTTTVRRLDRITAPGGGLQLTSGRRGPVLAYRTADGLQLLLCSDVRCESFDRQMLRPFEAEQWSVQYGERGVEVFAIEPSTRTGRQALVHIMCNAANCEAPVRAVLGAELGEGFLRAGLAPGSTVVYVDRDARMTRLFLCNRSGCQWMGNVPFVENFTVEAVAIESADEQGWALVTVEQPGGVVRRTVCADRGCASFRRTVLASGATNRVIARKGVDGLPFFLFAAGEKRELQFLHCTDSRCEGSKVRNLGDRSAYSVTEGLGGLPMVTVRDSTPRLAALLSCRMFIARRLP
jgi:hypothetical protein